MGIESDQLVYDYLSRVADMAQQRQLSSGERMRLVSTLRNEIDRQRGKFGSDSPAAVRRILGRLGSPSEVVDATPGRGPGPGPGPGQEAAGGPEVPETAVPEQRTRRGAGRRVASLRKDTPAPRDEPQTGSPPHLAGMHELGPSGSEPDWWRVEPGPLGAATGVSGFVGGVEIPEILKPPPTPEELAEAEEKLKAEEAEKEPGATAARRRWLPVPRLRRRTEKTPTGGAGLTNPLLLLAAALLVAGALLGSWPALGGGWLLAYASRRLTRAEAKLAVFGLPVVSFIGGLVWLWGRSAERWGEAIPKGGMGDAISETWPVVVRIAAVASALFLVWRSRRK